MHLQRAFATVQHGSENTVGNIFVLFSGGKIETKLPWVAMVLLLVKLSARKTSETADFAFIQFIECISFRQSTHVFRVYLCRMEHWKKVKHTLETLGDSKISRTCGVEIGLG